VTTAGEGVHNKNACNSLSSVQILRENPRRADPGCRGNNYGTQNPIRDSSSMRNAAEISRGVALTEPQFQLKAAIEKT
jgi:hypothetical protein